MAYRNLSIAYCNKEQDLAKAMTAMKNALALDPAIPASGWNTTSWPLRWPLPVGRPPENHGKPSESNCRKR